MLLLYQVPCGFDQVPVFPQPVVGGMYGAGAGFDTLLNPENCCAVGAVRALGSDIGTALLFAVCGPRVMLLGPTPFGLLGSMIN